MFRIDRAAVGIRLGNVLTIPTRAVETSEPEPEEETVVIEEVKPPPRETPEEVFERAQEQANQVLRMAREDVSNMLQQAYVQSDAIKNDAYQEGYNQGKEEGMAEGQRIYAQQVNAIAALIERIGALREQIIDDIERDVVALAMDIAGKIVRSELMRSDETYLGMVRGALRVLKAEGRVTVRVSPMEYEMFFADGASAIGRIGADNVKVSAVADESLSIGDIVIESDTGSINAGVQSQLDAAAAALGVR